MRIDISLGYEYWLNTVASIMDNPLDSIHTTNEAIEAVAQAFNKDGLGILGQALNLLLEEPKKGKWEIVS